LPSVEGRHNGRQLILDVAVLASDNPADLTFVEGCALLNTGSTVCGIGPRIIAELGLKSHGKRPLSSATELRMVEYYYFRLGLFANPGELPFVFAELDGFGWPEAKPFDLILGMDVLRQCDFRMDRTGGWELRFG
jgi:hypothetical protein